MKRFVPMVCVVAVLISHSTLHAKIRPGDEERLLKLAGELAAQREAFRTMEVKLVQESQSRLSRNVLETTLWIDGDKTAFQTHYTGHLPNGEVQTNYLHHIITPDDYVSASGPEPYRMIGVGWYELKDGKGGSERVERWRKLHTPPNPVLEATQLSDRGISEPPEALVRSGVVWKIDDVPDAPGLVLITRTTPAGHVLDEFTVDTKRGPFIIDHKNYGPAAMQRHRTIALQQVGDVWFPSVLTLEYVGPDAISAARYIDVKLNQPIPAARFEVTAVSYPELALLMYQRMDGTREPMIRVLGCYFPYKAGREIAAALGLNGYGYCSAVSELPKSEGLKAK